MSAETRGVNAEARHGVKAETRHGGGPKFTKTTKTTKATRLVFFAIVIFVIFVSAFAAQPLRRDLAVARVPLRAGAGGPPPWRVAELTPWRVSAQTPQSTQKPPVFRAGAHYVRVDAYPTTKDGRIVEGLSREEFELYEDGALQTIDSFEYIAFPSWTPEAERKDPRNQQEGFQLAADPTYRVFAVVIDREAFDMVGWNVMHRPLIDFLERNLGPKDLFGLIDSKSEWTDFVLAQRTTTARVELSNPAWWQRKDDYDDYEWALLSCGLEPLIPRSRVDRTYSLLQGLVQLFAVLRDERKSIIYVSNGLPTIRGGMRTSSGTSGAPEIPKIGVTPGGRLGPMPRNDVVGGGSPSTFCNTERMRLEALETWSRYDELLKTARAGNVAFYPISPLGLQGYEFTREGKLDLAGHRRQQALTDTLIGLANETDGIAIMNTNDLRAGLTRISNDLRAYYVLGYYTTNTKWDGGLRSIRVKLKPGASTMSRVGAAAELKAGNIRARRQYRAPTPAEIAAMASAIAPPTAKSVPPPPVPTLVRKPAVFVVRGRGAPEPGDVMGLSRTERMRVEWEVAATLDHRTARILDRTGKPLAVDVPLTEPAGRVVVDLPLAPFARGEYTLELTIGSGSIVERSLLAFRVQ